jgi:hypothetical protein
MIIIKLKSLYLIISNYVIKVNILDILDMILEKVLVL